ncbi:MAG: competence protein ComE [Methylococcaceae bacterium]|nr:MAG: competence protein ComE [Methylococcaceae bacterium]
MKAAAKRNNQGLIKVFTRGLVVLFLALLPLWAWAEPLDINTATADQLAAAMVGVGKAKAETIVKDRDAHGPFKSVEDMERVQGIGKATISKNKDKLMVKGAAPAVPAPAAPKP